MIVTHDRSVTRYASRVLAIRDGQTSSEIVRRVGHPGADESSHEEFVIVDETGRLQIPRAYLEELGFSGRAKVDVDDGCLLVRPVGASGEPAADDASRTSTDAS